MVMAKSLTKFSSGFLWLFLAGLFLFLKFNINETDIFPDILGYVFAIVGCIYFIVYSSILEKKYRILVWILSLFIFLSLINNLAGFLYKTEITNDIFISINSWSFPVALLSVALIGYNFSEKYLPSLQKRWKILSGIFGIFFILFAALKATSLFINQDMSFSGSLSGLYAVIMTLAGIVLTIYSFSTIWKTYSLSKSENR